LNKKTPKLVEKKDKKLTNMNLYSIHATLVACKNIKGRKFAYMVAKNARIIEPELKALNESLPHIDKLNDLQKELSEFSAANKKESNPNFLIEYEKIKEKYTGFVTENEDSRKSMLEEDIDIVLYKLDERYLPEEITGAQLTDLFDCVKWESENNAK